MMLPAPQMGVGAGGGTGELTARGVSGKRVQRPSSRVEDCSVSWPM